jgi:hypothetical protein
MVRQCRKAACHSVHRAHAHMIKSVSSAKGTPLAVTPETELTSKRTSPLRIRSGPPKRHRSLPYFSNCRRTVDTLVVTIMDGASPGVIMLSFNKSPNDKRCVTTLSDFRRIALSMPETEELNGMGYPNFRTGRKSFATVEDKMVVIRLTCDQQAIFVATAPEVFAPDSSGWGRLGNTVIRLEMADEATVQVAVATAWRNVAEVGNASEVVDVTDVEEAIEFVNTAEIVETGCAAEATDIRTGNAAEVNATGVNARHVSDEVSAAEVVNRAGLVETGDLAELVNATVVANAAGAAEGGAAEVPNGAEVVETENAALPSVIRRQATNAGNHGERSMALTLLAVVKRKDVIDLKYGEAFDDPQPFILTVTPEYVAHETAKSVPISASDLHAYILAHAAKLRATAENFKRRDLTSEVLR